MYDNHLIIYFYHICRLAQEDGIGEKVERIKPILFSFANYFNIYVILALPCLTTCDLVYNTLIVHVLLRSRTLLHTHILIFIFGIE